MWVSCLDLWLRGPGRGKEAQGAGGDVQGRGYQNDSHLELSIPPTDVPNLRALERAPKQNETKSEMPLFTQAYVFCQGLV